jgi:hypothetical protein
MRQVIHRENIMLRICLFVVTAMIASCSVGGSCGIGADEDPNNPGVAADGNVGEGEGEGTADAPK